MSTGNVPRLCTRENFRTNPTSGAAHRQSGSRTQSYQHHGIHQGRDDRGRAGITPEERTDQHSTSHERGGTETGRGNHAKDYKPEGDEASSDEEEDAIQDEEDEASDEKEDNEASENTRT